MISAKLIKDLEKKGFELDFPAFESNENRIIEILSGKNDRLFPAIPIFLTEHFNYDHIQQRLKPPERKKFDRIILIADRILKKEKLSNTYTRQIIKDKNIKQKIPKQEFDYYHAAFRESQERKKQHEEGQLQEQIGLRSTLNINKALATIYAPGKLRILNKIYNHEKLTNTELKYYYRSIRPFILAILNENMQKYLRIIESTKKYT